MTQSRKKISLALLFTRLSIFSVMIVWTFDKFFNPNHAVAVFGTFYGLQDLGHYIIYAIAIAQFVLVILFLIGYKKFFTYGAILVLHSFTTFVSYTKYLDPFSNLLFFAAWPMLAACLLLFLLREEDTLLAVH